MVIVIYYDEHSIAVYIYDTFEKWVIKTSVLSLFVFNKVLYLNSGS